jgi:hypothetical protein
MSDNEESKEQEKRTPVTASYLKELREVIELSDTYKERLTDWEHNFLSSISERIEKYEEDTFLSAKQLEVIEKISKKIYKV